MTEPTDMNNVPVAPEYENMEGLVRFRNILDKYITLPGLNLGCGITPIQGWVNADLYNNPDVRFDMRESWPLENNSFDTIYAGHVLEHFTGEEIFHIFWEAGRVLRPGGNFIGVTPYGYSDMQFSTLHHKTPWLPGTVDCVTEELYTRDDTFQGMTQGVSHRNWKKLLCVAKVDYPFNKFPTWLYKFCSLHLLNVHSELIFVLTLEDK